MKEQKDFKPGGRRRKVALQAARIVLTTELIAWLDEEAERRADSRSSIVRQAVRQFRAQCQSAHPAEEGAAS